MFFCLFMEMMKSHMNFNEHIFVSMNSDTIMKTIVKYVIDMKAILKKKTISNIIADSCLF